MGIDPGRSIVWYCQKTWEPWSPKTLQAGLAGSQAAVVYLSGIWAKLGFKVEVYNFCDDMEGEYEGVTYKGLDKFDTSRDYDNLIIWRERGLDLLDKPLKARRIILELHDQPYRTGKFLPARLDKVNIFVTKSRSHFANFKKQQTLKNYIRRFTVIPNGADLKFLRPEEASKRDPFRMIYASNYERGLEEMLRYGWPLIKKAIPQAGLAVYYGWGAFDSFHSDPASRAWKLSLQELMSSTGVADFGRVGLDELIKIKTGSSIHYYGCTWHETDCVTVRESAMAGCVPVTTRYSAIAEKPYCLTVPGDPKDRKTQERLARVIIDLLKNPKKLERLRRRCVKYASRESWDSVAPRWLKLFV